jgi:hypothetical protein
VLTDVAALARQAAGPEPGPVEIAGSSGCARSTVTKRPTASGCDGTEGEGEGAEAGVHPRRPGDLMSGGRWGAGRACTHHPPIPVTEDGTAVADLVEGGTPSTADHESARRNGSYNYHFYGRFHDRAMRDHLVEHPHRLL